jgi:ATP-dependent DNA helicase PIF1
VFRVTDVAEARAWIHAPGELAEFRHAKSACQQAVLAPHNAGIQDHNDYFLECIPGEPVRLLAAEQLDVEQGNAAEPMVVTEELMTRMHDTGAPDHTITLKPGCLIMCLRNLSPQLGVLNGTLLKVVSASAQFRYIVANTVTLSEPPVRVLIPGIKFKLSVPGGAAQIERLQFPVRLAYGMTINKSQGKTLLRVLLDLRCEVFGHGQLYVGSGRVTCAANIAFLVSPDRIHASLDGEVVLTSNIVYPELLSERGVDVAPVVDLPAAPVAEPQPFNVLNEWNAPIDAPEDWDADA